MLATPSVGEPLNAEAWEWLYNVAGEGRCPIADTWWQTGTFISDISMHSKHVVYYCLSLFVTVIVCILSRNWRYYDNSLAKLRENLS